MKRRITRRAWALGLIVAFLAASCASRRKDGTREWHLPAPVWTNSAWEIGW